MYCLTKSTIHKLNSLSDKVRNKNILVTGGSGFIGKYLVTMLGQHDANVTVLSRSNIQTESLSEQFKVNVLVGDITDEKTIANCCKDIDILIHMAGCAHVEEVANDTHKNISVSGTKNILNEALSAGVKSVIYISSVKAMGDGNSICLDESAPANPADNYGKSRLEAEKIILNWGAENSVKASVLRLPLVYGAGVKGNIRRILTSSKIGRSIPFPETKNNRSMVYVGDVIQAIYCVIHHPNSGGNLYIVTDEQEYATSDLFNALGNNRIKWKVPIVIFKFLAVTGNAIEFLTKIRVPFNLKVFRKLFGSACYRSDKIKKELGYQPTETFYSVLEDMLDAK